MLKPAHYHTTTYIYIYIGDYGKLGDALARDHNLKSS